jgi:hypothetical protein
MEIFAILSLVWLFGNACVIAGLFGALFLILLSDNKRE